MRKCVYVFVYERSVRGERERECVVVCVCVREREAVANIVIYCLVESILLFHFALQLRTLAYEELEQRLSDLDPEMEREIEELRARYQAKRQPIQEAIDAKKKRQQNF